jgi:hypothetical protein
MSRMSHLIQQLGGGKFGNVWQSCYVHLGRCMACSSLAVAEAGDSTRICFMGRHLC